MDRASSDPFVRILRFAFVVPIAMVLMGGLLGLLWLTQPVTWTGTSQVLYGGNSSGLLTGVAINDSDVQRTLATQTQVVLSDGVMRGAAKDLGVRELDLLDATSVQDLPDSNVISISVTGPSAREAQRRTRRVTDGYLNYTKSVARKNLTRQADSLGPSIDNLRAKLAAAPQSQRGPQSAVSVSLAALLQRQGQLTSAAQAEQGSTQLISEPPLPQKPSSPSTLTISVVGAGIGLVLGVGLAMLLARIPSRPTRRVGDQPVEANRPPAPGAA